MLSLVIPGAGHMYVGNVGLGVLILVTVVIGYMFVIPGGDVMFVIPGIVLHVIAVVAAFAAARAKAPVPAATDDAAEWAARCSDACAEGTERRR